MPAALHNSGCAIIFYCLLVPHLLREPTSMKPAAPFLIGAFFRPPGAQLSAIRECSLELERRKDLCLSLLAKQAVRYLWVRAPVPLGNNNRQKLQPARNPRYTGRLLGPRHFQKMNNSLSCTRCECDQESSRVRTPILGASDTRLRRTYVRFSSRRLMST